MSAGLAHAAEPDRALDGEGICRENSARRLMPATIEIARTS